VHTATALAFYKRTDHHVASKAVLWTPVVFERRLREALKEYESQDVTIPPGLLTTDFTWQMSRNKSASRRQFNPEDWADENAYSIKVKSV
jgi:hypothetical protein